MDVPSPRLAPRVLGAACVALLAIPLSGCGKDESRRSSQGGDASQAHVEVPPGWPSESARRTAQNRLPSPFTVEQIRDATPAGRIDEYRLVVAGQPPPRIQTIHWVRTRPEDADFELTSAPEGTAPEGMPSVATTPWRAIQANASFPSASATVVRESVTVPAGTFDALRYDVTERTKDGKTKRTKFWYAFALPGPAVLQETTVDGVFDGSMTLVRTRRAGAPESGGR